jgi:predicted enzyme related to lactoylglutathione lyase
MEKTPEGENGWFMNFTDPEGNRFGAYETKVQCDA